MRVRPRRPPGSSCGARCPCGRSRPPPRPGGGGWDATWRSRTGSGVAPGGHGRRGWLLSTASSHPLQPRRSSALAGGGAGANGTGRERRSLPESSLGSQGTLPAPSLRQARVGATGKLSGKRETFVPPKRPQALAQAGHCARPQPCSHRPQGLLRSTEPSPVLPLNK